MKERTNEETLDLFCDLLDPFSEILQDQAVAYPFRHGGTAMDAVKPAIRNHKKAVIEILALLDGVDVEKYHVSLLTLPIKLVRLFNMPEVRQLFTMQGGMSAVSLSGSAMENTGGAAN